MQPIVITIPDGVSPADPVSPSSTAEVGGAATTSAVVNWEQLFGEDFEGTFPAPDCVAFANPSATQAYWGVDDQRAAGGSSFSGWPARAGPEGVDPEFSPHPPNMDTFLKCGPYDLSAAQTLLARFERWMEINDPDDFVAVGVSLDGIFFNGIGWSGIDPNWIRTSVYAGGVAGDDSVWVAWVFQSDSDGFAGLGVWIDNLEIWRYNTPALTCGELDPGNKGVVVDAYETVITETVPIIRPGDTYVVDGL